MTDQTSAHDPLNGYIPAGLTLEQAEVLRARGPRRVPAPGRRVGAGPRRRDPRPAGPWASRRSTTATRCAASASEHGDDDAFAYPGFVPAYIRPLFCEGKGPFRWVALSGDPADIHADRRGDPRPVRRPGPHPPLDRAGRASGSRSRACRRGSAGSATASATWPACASTRWWPSGELRAPVVIGRDHLDAGSVASPQRETESMLDGQRRGRRLAAAERAAQHRHRRELGVLPSRRRRRDGQVAARRAGVRRRRHAAGRRAHPAHAARRPGHGHRPPRRRGLSRGARRRRPAAVYECRCDEHLSIRERRARSCGRVGGRRRLLRRCSRSKPGGLAIREGADRGVRGRSGRRHDHRRRAAARSSRASSTATRTCRSPAGARASTR